MTSSFSSTCTRGLVAAAVAVVAASALGAAGCYKPKIRDGGLLCNTSFDPVCPDGYHCVGLVCLLIGEDGGIDQAVEAHPEASVDHAPDVTEVPDVQPDAPCYASVAGCTPDASGLCDPVCQSGCGGCHEKCSVNTGGKLTCNVSAPALPRDEGQSCSPASEGTMSQTDDCKPGLVCFDETCGSLCVRFCRGDNDCPSSTCSRVLPGGLMGCDVPTTTCNPVSTTPDCPAAAQGCYLSTSQADKTFCDCPANAQPPGAGCNDSRDCNRGLTCVDATGTGAFTCHVTCSLVATTSGCPATQTCHPLGANVKYGYCN